MKYQLKEISEALLDLSDEETQLDAWFLGSKGISSPSEMINRLFDLGIDIIVADNQAPLSDMLRGHLTRLIEYIDQMEDYNDPWNAYASQEWINIRLYSKICYKEFKSIALA